MRTKTRREEEVEAKEIGGGGSRGRGERMRRVAEREGSIIEYDCF